MTYTPLPGESLADVVGDYAVMAIAGRCVLEKEDEAMHAQIVNRLADMTLALTDAMLDAGVERVDSSGGVYAVLVDWPTTRGKLAQVFRNGEMI
jgi:hypothetical protein